jgi:hypothetical protein
MTTLEAFDEIVAAWDEQLCCQTKLSPKPCRNPATWLAIHHGPHGEVPVCSFHKTWWQRWAWKRVCQPRVWRCPDCGQAFATPYDCTTFRRI